MKVAFFSTKPYDKTYFNAHNKNQSIVYFETRLNKTTCNLASGFDAVCVFVNDMLDREVIELLHQHGIKLIALRCAGFNNVDLEAAREYGLQVSRVPAYSPEAVAEHALALILTLNRKTHKAYNRVKECNFSLNNLVGFNVYKKTVGVIGTGKIGQAFCRIMKALGCEVIAFDPYPSQDLKEFGISYVDLDHLLQKSDIISLHCPLTEQTKHIINENSLKQLKPNCMLINTSRGALIDTEAVIQGLKEKQVGYLGIDVYEQEEKLFFEDLSEHIIDDDLILRLIGFPNVLITSHQAFLTEEALHEISKSVLNDIRQFEETQELINPVNT
ncbi:2-hydroxyacid dehydrogenase [Psychroflexus sp. YR1-1]|uniref:2-hydroxyacid dehydrogenase n=1 Tax=Psychroflexus aurantiacus TaxID=2709310 RepID=A0A6B3R2D9_9FLAO|nr:2-hydroxyacid dehydrogenase [Psychroflexus aurantiacus]NEV94819.1 2-hydroxyacid dehydrogenase [Psychroflexus aurantiacus]